MRAIMLLLLVLAGCAHKEVPPWDRVKKCRVGHRMIEYTIVKENVISIQMICEWDKSTAPEEVRWY